MPSNYLPFWLGGLALIAVPVLHWLVLGRSLAVSGRFSWLVDRARHGEAEPAPDADALLAAIRAATEQAFGTESLEAAAPVSAETSDAVPPARESAATHTAFLFGLILGGLVSTVLLPGGLQLVGTLRGAGFARMLGHGPLAYVALFLGGSCVGFGTRMAGGCTSGHGLCGLSQRQPGSFVATCAFFGAGVLTSFVLEAL